jgi:hypothetical protein
MVMKSNEIGGVWRVLAAAAVLMSPFFSFPAVTQAPLSAQLANCLTIFGAVERLACYDRVARGITGPAAVPAQPYSPPPPSPVQGNFGARVPVPAPLPAAAPLPPPAGNTASAFGSERLPEAESGQPARLNRITAGIVNFTLDPHGKFILTLSNGQVWRQLESDDSIARPRKSARSVIIERALFSSYGLIFNDAPQRYKVIRVR